MTQNSKKSSVTPEVHYCVENKIACDGGDGALGHPRVYLQMDDAQQAVCPYCDKQYIKTGGVSDKR